MTRSPVLAVVALVLASAGLAGTPACAWPESVNVRFEGSAGRLRVVLPAQATVESPRDTPRREVVVRFDHAVELGGLDDLLAQTFGLVEGVSIGYDSLLLRATRAVEAGVTVSAAETILVLTPAAQAHEPPGQDDDKAELRLELLRARWNAETGRAGSASSALRSLSARNPADPDVLASRANVELQLGRWRRADALYREALALAPGNEDLAGALTRLHREQGSRGTLEYTRKVVADGWSEDVMRAAGQVLLGGGVRTGVTVDHSLVRTGVMRRAGGGLGTFDGTRHRAELLVQKSLEAGAQMSGAFFLDRTNRGAGIGFLRGDSVGSFRLAAEFRRPYWEFVEGLVDGGYRNRLEVNREQRISRRLNGWFQGSVNRYGMDGERNAASSAGLSGGVTYTLASSPGLALQYGFDGEYGSSVRTRTLPEGALYSPIPLVSREVHAFDLALGGTVRRSVRLDGLAGYAWDRLGGSGPYLAMRFTGNLSAKLDAEADFERRLSSVNTGSAVNRLTGRVVWKLGQ